MKVDFRFSWDQNDPKLRKDFVLMDPVTHKLLEGRRIYPLAREGWVE